MQWITASEENSDYFIVEKSRNSIDFETLCRVNAAGNSRCRMTYHATDENPYYDITYYRLKQVDFDGTFHYSEIIPVKGEDNTPHPVIYNPARQEITIYAAAPSNVAVRLINLPGQIVYEKEYRLTEGENVFHLNDLNAATGNYYLRVDDSAGNNSVKRIFFRSFRHVK